MTPVWDPHNKLNGYRYKYTKLGIKLPNKRLGLTTYTANYFITVGRKVKSLIRKTSVYTA